MINEIDRRLGLLRKLNISFVLLTVLFAAVTLYLASELQEKNSKLEILNERLRVLTENAEYTLVLQYSGKNFSRLQKIKKSLSGLGFDTERQEATRDTSNVCWFDARNREKAEYIRQFLKEEFALDLYLKRINIREKRLILSLFF